MSEPITLVVTDIRDSTSQWEACPEAFTRALLLHDSVIRGVLVGTAGYEVRTEGDGFRLAFLNVSHAIRFCLEARARIARLPWPGLPAPLSVRFGVHTGEEAPEIDPASGRVDFRGLDLIRAERVADAAHSGQVLLSESAARLLAPPSGGAPSVSLQPLGRWLLPSFDGPTGLWLALAPGETAAPVEPPRARPAPLVPSNLDPAEEGVLGRAAAIECIRGLFASGARAVQIHGQAGVGKTALARAVGLSLALSARPLPGGLAGGVWAAELGGLATPRQAAVAIAEVVGADPESPDLLGGLAAALAGRGPCLLVLDGADDPALGLGRLLNGLVRDAPLVRVLITTRVRLRLPGVRELRLGPLPTPEPDDDLVDALELPSVALFLRHAEATVPGFRADMDVRALLRVVHLLGGLPLAIALAASRLRLLSLSGLEARLRARPLDVLNARTRRRDRLTSLGAALERTWAGLSEEARLCLARLSYIQGSFDSAAAAAVVGLLPWPAEAPEVLRGLQEDGLVIAGRDGVRWRLSAPLAAYAAERHALFGEAERSATRDRHAVWYAALGDPERPDARDWEGDPIRLRELAANRDDLRLAFDWLEARAPETALGAALAALEVDAGAGAVARGLALARRAAALPGISRRGLVRLGLAATQLYLLAERVAEARGEAERAVAAAQQTQDPRWLGDALRALASAEARDPSRRPQALDACEAALSVARLGWDPLGEGLATALRAELRRTHDRAGAIADLRLARAALSRAGTGRLTALALSRLAGVIRELGELERAPAADGRGAAACL